MGQNTFGSRRARRGVIAVGLTTLGVMLLLGIGELWPFFVLAPGLILLNIAVNGDRNKAAFAIPGMVITGTGLLLLLQNLTGYWDSWSYAWTLYGVFLGMGLAMMGRLLGDQAFEALGRVLILVGSVAFVVLGLLMEVVVRGLGAEPWPLLLIGMGLLLLARPFTLRRALAPKKKKQDDHLFTGPVVYGSRTRDASRLSADHDEQRDPRR